MNFAIGQAASLLAESAKQAAAEPYMSYGMVGELQYSDSGWLLLTVPNAIVRGAFAALSEPGVELSLFDDGRLNAHISVMRPEEIATIPGGADRITERGRDFPYTLGPVRSVAPLDWDDISRVWYIEVRSPALKKLRRSYGLTPLPKNNEHQFHITIAVRRKGTLASNAQSKAASLIHCGDVMCFFNKAAQSTRQMIATERRKVEQPTSEEQADAGNYRKGHVTLHGLKVSIENGRGSTRSGTSPDGKKWSVKMKHDYGYIRTSTGSDGDSVDVFIGGSPDTELVFVVNQLDPATGKFDEHKVFLGFNTEEEAKEGYLANYEEGWEGMGEVTVLTVPQFKWWLAHGDTKKPIKDGLFAKKAARGIPNRADVGDLAKLAPGLADFVIQFHQARRAGPHFDVRFGTPETGLYSWATRHKLPEPGKRRALFRQPLHSHDYGSFEGNLPVGEYGAGQVRIHRKGRILVTKVKPGLIEFTTADKRYPERFKLLRPAGWKSDDWLLVNTTPREAMPYDKVHFRKVDGTQVDKALDKMQQGDSIEAKIDGASSLIKLLEKGVEITSYRTSKETGRPIVHTERVFHGRPETEIPKELVGTVLRGELYGQGPKGVIPAQELGGLLNATIANSIAQQKERGVRLRNMIYDIQQLGSQPIDVNQITRPERRNMMKEVIKHLPDKVFHLSEAVEDPGEARRLWAQIQAGEHPLTSEGVVGHPAVGRPWKGKLTEEADVHVTGVFPGEGRLADTAAGGLEYALEPSGPTIGRVGTGFSDETRRALWADPEAYVGRVARIRAQEQHPSGAYRAPAFLAFHEDYPLLTKEGEITYGPEADAVAIRCFLPEADLPLHGGIEKRGSEEERPPVVAVDLDGTILDYDGWKGEDHFGKPRVGARKGLRELQRRGCLIVINTCRGNVQAVKDILHEHDLPYDYVNENPHQPPGTSDKIQADAYIDDRAIQARQPWSKITKETVRRIKAAELFEPLATSTPQGAKKDGEKQADQGSFYLAALRGTPITYDPHQSAVRNLVRHFARVRWRGDQAIREAHTQDSLANAADPDRAIRQFSAYLAGKRRPIVHHGLDRIIQGDL